MHTWFQYKIIYENHSTHSFKNIYTYQVCGNINIFNIKNLGPVISVVETNLCFFCRKKGLIRSSWAENIRDLSENITGVEVFYFCSQHLGPPPRIGRICVPLLRGLAESEYPLHIMCSMALFELFQLVW